MSRHLPPIALMVRLACVLALTGLQPLAALAAPPVFAWAEGENPSQAGFAFDSQAAGPAGILSGGKWLNKFLSKDDAAKQVPADGLQVRYDLDAPVDGEYEAWARVGFEQARAPFEWRVGDGEWARVSPNTRTTNLMRLGTWMEVAWLRLGTVTVKAGTVPLQFRVREPNGDRLMFSLDCVALVKGRWSPEGRLKPGEGYDGEADRAAAAHAYRLPEAAPGARARVALTGAWQAARFDDPDMDAQPYAPVTTLPSDEEYPLRWMGVHVPGPAHEQRPELAFAHRLLYRARVDVPAGMAGHSFFLHFAGTNWLVSVFVNGQLMGTHRGVLVPWDQDITRGIRPGQVNEIVVAVKGPMYARDTKAQNTSLEKARNIPLEGDFNNWARWVAPIFPSTKGEGDGRNAGIINPVTLVAAGPVYTADVFVMPSVARKRIDADVTLANPGMQAQAVQVTCEAVNARTGRVEKTFPTMEATVEAGGQKTVAVSGEWANPKLWWPVDNPDIYYLRTRVESGDDGRRTTDDQPSTLNPQPSKPLDSSDVLFGFREITLTGKQIRINGVVRNFWNWVEASGEWLTPEAWLKRFREEGNRFFRFAQDHALARFFPAREDQLDYADRNGVPGRLSTCVDGMFINYDLNNPLVWENFREHIAQAAKAYRNHPSVIVYSIENELVYINGQNIGQVEPAEKGALEMARAGQAVDPTRPYMVDGGGALKGNLLPVDCPHYPEAPTDFYPDNAYTLARIADHSSRWPWDRQRPLIVGESFFYAGKLEDQAWIGGDRVFRGRDEANRGASRYAQLLLEGYRWQGVAGVCPWVSLDRIPGADRVFRDLAAFPRKRAYRFSAGRENRALVKVFNDTLSIAPLAFEWALEVGGKRAAGGKEILTVESGTGVERTLRFTAPVASKRTPAALLLRVSQNGRVGYEQRLPVSILPTAKILNPQTSTLNCLLFDRSGRLLPFLRARGAKPTVIGGLDALKGKTGLLLIGPDTLTAEEAYAPDVLAFAARGGHVIALEQETPLAGSGLPAPVRATGRAAGYAFAQAPGTPLFANLGAGDLEDWAGDAPTAKRLYVKPSGGARSLIECGDGLNYSALIEAPCGQGVIVACQMRVGVKLGTEPAADHLLANLLARYAGYRPARAVTAVLAPPDSPIWKAVAATGALASRASSLAEALDPVKYRVAVVPATAANLRALEAAKAGLARFARAGGWVMLWGLQPDGLAAFNRLAGTSHSIRPFRLERVTLERPEHPLAATLGNRDLTFYSPVEIMFGDYWLSEHVYSYVVGGEDIAPFCRMPEGPDNPLAPYKPTFDDHDPFNYVNSLLNSDSWRYIRQIWVPKEGAAPLVFGFRRPEAVRQINLWNNTNYWTIKDLDILFDGDTAHPLRVTLPPNGEKVAVKLPAPRRVTKSITLQIRSWRGDPIVRDGQELRLVGLDNVQFLRAVPLDEARRAIPLDNIGGLVACPMGRGGLLLNQLKLAADDPNPQNQERKVRLVATLLQNMGAGMRSSAVVVPGVNVSYMPLDITRWANRHIKERAGQAGWFGERGRDLGHLKVGRQFLADVEFHIPDYVNAPVPQSVMLGGPDAPDPLKGLPREVKGIEVGRKADALYFLHTAWITRPVADWERRDRNFAAPELFRYVVHYADGATAEIPVRLEEHVADWLQKEPRPLPGGRLAWSAPFPNAGKGDPRPVLYAMAWTNPRPDAPIAAIDVMAGKDSARAVPAVLAITAGSRKQGGASR